MSEIEICRQLTDTSYDATERSNHCMKRWPIITTGVAGATIGFLGTVYVGMAMGLATSFTTTATVALVIICPVIYAIWWKWWLVPILNGLLYGGIAFGIAKWRQTTPRRAGRCV